MVLIQTECQNYKKGNQNHNVWEYNSHTEPLFKCLNLLKVDDIFTCQCKSFYYKFVNKNVPLFCKLLFTYDATHYEYHTRHNLQLVIPYSHTSRARKSVRYHLPSLLRSMPQCVIEKIQTHSLNGFSLYLKKQILSQYNDYCSIINCYICGIHALLMLCAFLNGNSNCLN